MERRFTDRMPTEVGVACRVPASPERARLVDVSRSGCRLEFVLGFALLQAELDRDGLG